MHKTVKNKFLCFFIIINLFTNVIIAQQKNALINSGQLLKEGNELYNKQQYKQAIKLYQQINRNDTNYSTALYELSLSCSADSQFTNALTYAKLGLKTYPEQFPKFSMQAANALDDLDQPNEALKLYEEALRKDPQSYLLYFNKAITLVKLNNDVDAKLSIQQCLLINPYYASGHYVLGNIYLRQGNLIAAMLAFKTYLLINPSGKYNKRCVTNLSSIANTTDDVLEYVKNKKANAEDNFDLLQQILISKIALDKQYELKAKLEDKIVRQIQVVNEKLEYKRNDKGFAMQFYVPFYNKIFKENDFEALIFTLFSGLEIKDVDTWVKKNKKEIEPFLNKAVVYLNEIKYTRVLIEPERKNTTIRYYFDDGIFQGKGYYTNENKTLSMTGDWEFFHPSNGLLKAKGKFGKPNEKEGEWMYYYETGKIKEKGTYKNGQLNGQLQGWFENGNRWYSNNYIDGKLNGTSIGYYYNDNLKRTIEYTNDKKNGKEVGYTSFGTVDYILNFADDLNEGIGINYYSNGAKKNELNYSKGKAVGTYKSYFKDGKIQFEGEFLNDEKEGLWTKYYNNGNIEEKTTYKEGYITGEFTEYHENGKLSRKGNYYRKKIDGKLEDFTDEGILFSDATYEKGKLREINFYDAKGNNISSTSTRKGAADITFLTPEGLKSMQGFFNKDGNKDGEFTNYYATGKMSEKTTYVDGLKEGNHTSYYSNGQKNIENNFTKDEENGYSKSFYYNGVLNNEGWVVNGDKQQNQTFYDQLGAIKSNEYYLDNLLNGYSEYYFANGKKDCEYKYKNSWLQQIIQYDTTGKIIAQNDFENGKGSITYNHFNGKKYIESNYNAYMFQGSYKIYFFDGSINTLMYYKNDEKDSTYKNYYYGGQLQSEGKYVNGEKHGAWKYYYENGKISEEEIYTNGQLNGIDKMYNKDGSIEKAFTYKDNELDGETIYYGDNSQIALIFNYKKGFIKSYTYQDKTGKNVSPIILKGSTGLVKGFYKNGTQSVVMNFVNNDIEGERNFYFSNGKPMIIGKREYGYDNGSKKIYFESGTLSKDENYVLGNLHGQSKGYFTNGKIERELNYYNGSLHGVCTYYDETGKLKQTRIYYYGILQSVK